MLDTECWLGRASWHCAEVGAGVKALAEGDWVVPFKPGMGTWRSLAVWKEKDLMKMPADMMPMEYAAMMRELCTAYRLLEDHGGLHPGDAVILNAANGAVGTAVIQLCSILKLRPVVRRHLSAKLYISESCLVCR